MADKASIGFAIIAKDAAKYLEQCLKSIRPHVAQIVVGIDVDSHDKTERIAKRYADKVVPVEVSEWHECAQHGRIRAQHFARARNESFRHLDPSLDFWAWIDSDDVLENAHLLPAICKNIPEEAIGVWSPYLYAWVAKENGAREVNTVFHRERILRTKFGGQPVDWRWEHRIHEVVVPANVKSHPRWIENNDLRWVHQHQAHKSDVSAPRNLTCLEIELEEKPDDARSRYYMGNTYFALGDWVQAAQWYEDYTERFGATGNPYEVWQSYCYLSRCYEKMQDVSSALQAVFGAIDARPEHPEPYLQLAAIYAQLEQPDKCIYWTEQALQRPEAPFFVFKNPMDKSFNMWLPLADAHLQMGNIAEAKRCWDRALQAFPEPAIKEKAEWATRRLQAEQAANNFLGTIAATKLEPDEMIALYEKLPDQVKSFARTRNLPMGTLRARRKALSQPKIIFWCGRAAEPWAPPSLNTTGIGGSETAVVEIAKRFATAGWLVDVYCGADYMEGVYDGVGYWEPERLAADEECDVFVSWRNPRAHDMPVKAKQKVLWCHDLNYGPDVAEDMHQWDKVLGVSNWHAEMLGRYYELPPTAVYDHGKPKGQRAYEAAWVDYVPNGIDPTRFGIGPDLSVERPLKESLDAVVESMEALKKPAVKKVPYRCVYASSPDRGLARLLSLWPAILKTEPAAELHVAYGWETMDKMIASGRGDLAHFKADMTKRIESSEGVVWRGRLGQQDLANLYSEAWLWLYPTDFLEVSCISAMEAMAGGAVPITTKCGALTETVGSAGLLVPAPTTSRGYQDTYLHVVRGMLLDANQRLMYSEMGRGRAKTLTWEASFQKWLSVLGIDIAAPKAEPDGPLPTVPEEAAEESLHPEMVAA